MMHVLMIDNYDSFTYTLVQYLQELGIQVTTKRNDQITIPQIEQQNYDYFVISPGPSIPDNAGICLDLVKLAAQESIPLLGICLGHQSIAQYFGAKIIKIDPPIHGKTSEIFHQNEGLFAGLPNPFTATRYHSLTVERKSLPACLELSAQTQDGVVMGLKHKELQIEGVQFHPESVLTRYGKEMLLKFSDRAKAWRK